MAESTATRAHLNLVESSRRLFELDPAAELDAGPGWLFGAGSYDHPTITNAVFRTDDGFDPGELIERARGFFGPRRRGFCVWTRDGVDADRELAAACEAEGIVPVYEMPEMVLDGPADESPHADGVAIRRIDSADQAADYWRIAGASYTELGFPPEVFTQYTDGAGLLGEGVVAFFGEVDGEPAAIAMTIVTDGVAGIYWVGSLPTARGKGLGRAVTVAATNAGFDLGADLGSLQASPMGRPIYEAMGYRTIYAYRLLSCPPA
ncbi:MAG TPA: GNAT family N-acetyltransferase [Solirubrobacterales bacterium]